MKICGMRWGKEFGMACGPETSFVVEVRFEKDGKDVFVSDSLYDCFENFLVTGESAFETLTGNADSDEFEALRDSSIKEAELSFEDEETLAEGMESLTGSPFRQAILFTHMAMDAMEFDDDEGTAGRFIDAYIGKEVDSLVIPEPSVPDECEDSEESGEEDSDDSVVNEDDLLEDVRSAYEGQPVDTGLMELEEGETPSAWYRSYEFFHEGGKEYKLTYSFDLNDDGEFTGIDRPACERVEGDTVIPCAEGEVSIKRIYQELRDALDGWM